VKNNLKGITGLLRQFAQTHPELGAPLNQAIGQVRSIAVIHGLQGRRSQFTVRLCEMTREIALEIAKLWNTPVRLDIPLGWQPCIVAEAEAVPTALVLNELILNAVKHGRGLSHGVTVSLRKGGQADQIHLRISNGGTWRLLPAQALGTTRNGLRLVDAMLPRRGVTLIRTENEGVIHVQLTFAPPVITLEAESHAHVAADRNAPASETAAG
ncbi:hypothetical protein ACQV5M_19560, partial [Leptospira sp. SA-E8]|uniref:hypothetical protein n=1 Tax=Leptospira sp. SA-E8 TaxID=3422259 RepID=UPI003EC0B6D3